MDYKKMNDCERDKLKQATKNKIKDMFCWFKNSTYLKSDNQLDGKIKAKIEKMDVLKLVNRILNANFDAVKVECHFDNEFLHRDYRSGQFFIWGDAEINKNLENMISMKPSSKFTYEYEYDDSEEPEDYSRDFVSHLNTSGINLYRGTFSYTGIVSEDSARGCGGASIEEMKLFNEVQISYIEDNEPAWKKHIAASYRLYDGKSYQLAFLMAFIGFDSLIELINENIKEVYLSFENQIIDLQFKHYNSKYWTAIKLMREEILMSESYKRLEKLENPNRQLVNEKLLTILKFTNEWENDKCKQYARKFSFFEAIRNSLAHGNDYKKDYIQKMKSYKIYKNEKTNDIDFDKLYAGFILTIYELIEELIC